jgi:type VI protein secretion system component VasK
MNIRHSPLDTTLHRMGATGRQWERRYQVPWLMMVGEPGAGRTSLAASIGLRRPYGSPTQKEMARDSWGVWLFEQGVVLDMPAMTEEPTEEWRSVIRRLRHLRGQRPIDGLMLAVPATELVGPKALDEVQLDRKAQRLFEKLQSLRGELGVRVPIYVVITQSDAIAGFSAFCRTLPPRTRDEMLGWSSPHSPEEAYSPAWVDEAFQDIHQALSHMQLELLADGWGEPSDREAAFLFPSELRALAEPVRRLLDVLFQSTPYTRPSLLRGLYFCGDPEAGSTAGTGGKRASGPRSPAFVTQLVERKIFPESGLAGPDAEAARGNRRKIVMLQALLVACVLLALSGLGVTWARFRHADVATPSDPFPTVATSSTQPPVEPPPRPPATPPAERNPAPSRKATRTARAPQPAQAQPAQAQPAQAQPAQPAQAQPAQAQRTSSTPVWDDAPPPRATRRTSRSHDAPPPPHGRQP